MVLDVLDKIKQAENQIEQQRQLAQKECQEYEAQKQAQLVQLKTESAQEIEKLQGNYIALQAELLQQERQQLLEEAEQTATVLNERYEKNKEQVIDEIIERVKDVYGSQ